jgi:hypothetical protein
MKTIFPCMKQLFTTIALMGLLVLGASAADVTGKYTAETQGGRGPQTITIELKAEGSVITGSVSGRGPNAMAIENGKIDGDTITFSTTMKRGDNEMKMNYTGKVKGDSIDFTREGGRGPATFTAKKSS